MYLLVINLPLATICEPGAYSEIAIARSRWSSSPAFRVPLRSIIVISTVSTGNPYLGKIFFLARYASMLSF